MESDGSMDKHLNFATLLETCITLRTSDSSLRHAATDAVSTIARAMFLTTHIHAFAGGRP